MKSSGLCCLTVPLTRVVIIADEEGVNLDG
jgi:hypothetical protein